MTDIFEPVPDDDIVIPEDFDPKVAVKRLADKDKHIDNLESELAELRTDLRSRTTLEELINKFPGKPNPSDTQPEPNLPEPEPNSNPTPTLNLEEKVREILLQESSKSKREANVSASRTGLIQRFGKDYTANLKQVAETLGITEKWLADLSASSPEGFLKVVDSVHQSAPPVRSSAPPVNSVDTSRAFPQNVRKNKKYFDEIRKKDINVYFSRKVQQEMHDEAMRQGSAFYEP